MKAEVINSGRTRNVARDNVSTRKLFCQGSNCLKAKFKRGGHVWPLICRPSSHVITLHRHHQARSQLHSRSTLLQSTCLLSTATLMHVAKAPEATAFFSAPHSRCELPQAVQTNYCYQSKKNASATTNVIPLQMASPASQANLAHVDRLDADQARQTIAKQMDGNTTHFPSGL